MRSPVKQGVGGLHSDAIRPILNALLSFETVEGIHAENVELTGGRILLTTVTCGLGGLVERIYCGSTVPITGTTGG